MHSRSGFESTNKSENGGPDSNCRLDDNLCKYAHWFREHKLKRPMKATVISTITIFVNMHIRATDKCIYSRFRVG